MNSHIVKSVVIWWKKFSFREVTIRLVKVTIQMVIIYSIREHVIESDDPSHAINLNILLEKRLFNLYPWILEKESKTRDRHQARFRKKTLGRSVESFVFVSILWIFRKSRSVTAPKDDIYFCSARRFSLILAYAIWTKHHKIAKLALIARY